MKILIITTDYYPDLTPNTYRWQAIAEHWSRDAHEMHVLAPARSGIPEKTQQNGVWIHRKGNNTLLDWAYNLFGLKKRRNRTSEGGKTARNNWYILLNKLVSLTWRKLYWPDGSCLWYFSARKKAISLIKEHQPDILISVCLPFTSTWIAYYCKNRFPDLFWISDVEDPFALLKEQPKNNHRLYSGLNFRAEQKTIALADAVTLTVENTKALYIQQFGFGDKMFVIPPLFNIALSKTNTTYDNIFDNGKINIAYFGAFYFGIREPSDFLELLEEVLRINPQYKDSCCVHFFGGIEPEFISIFEQYDSLKGIIKLHGLIEREQVFQYMKEVDFLLNIGNKSSYQLPSKCVDYYYSAKPVINISYFKEDTFDDFFEAYPLYLSLDVSKKNNQAPNADKLKQFILENKGKVLAKETVLKKLTPYQTSSIAAKFLSLSAKGQ
jgi:hypothetical protein